MVNRNSRRVIGILATAICVFCWKLNAAELITATTNEEILYDYIEEFHNFVFPNHTGIYPRTLLDIENKANLTAAELLKHTSHKSAITKMDFVLLLKKVLALRERRYLGPPDVFAVLKLVAILFEEFGETEPNTKALGLVARAIMNAPFTTYTKITSTHDLPLNFAYFQQIALQYDCVTKQGSYGLADPWQVYFCNEAYESMVITTARALYNFYQQQSYWINAVLKNPQYSENLMQEIENRLHDSCVVKKLSEQSTPVYNPVQNVGENQFNERYKFYNHTCEGLEERLGDLIAIRREFQLANIRSVSSGDELDSKYCDSLIATHNLKFKEFIKASTTHKQDIKRAFNERVKKYDAENEGRARRLRLLRLDHRLHSLTDETRRIKEKLSENLQKLGSNSMSEIDSQTLKTSDSNEVSDQRHRHQMIAEALRKLVALKRLMIDAMKRNEIEISLTTKDNYIDEIEEELQKLATKVMNGSEEEEEVYADPNIFWRLLYALKGTSAEIQNRFFTMMEKAGADGFTIIDAYGTTPLDLAQQLGLAEIASRIEGKIQEVAQQRELSQKGIVTVDLPGEQTPTQFTKNIDTENYVDPGQTGKRENGNKRERTPQNEIISKNVRAVEKSPRKKTKILREINNN